MTGFIGVHVGAGNHSDKLLAEYKKVCRDACREGTSVLKRGGTAAEAVVAATVVLENAPITNAGIGSNLTWDGHVECDAMMMDGRTLLHGAVGAASGLKNPVTLARVLCEQQSVNGLSLGRVSPSLLVGEGAVSYAKQVGLTIVSPTELITARSLRLYKHYKRKVERFENVAMQQVIAPLDTVGAVCLDSQGHVAAACSSGGISIKCPGRVGQAAIFGCGCWAQDAEGDLPAVASTTTGCGEHLVGTMLAREVALGLRTRPCPVVGLHDIMRDKFLESPFLRGVDNKQGGVASIKHVSNEAGGEFLWAHSTTTMCVGYMSTSDTQPKSQLSSLPAGTEPGRKVVVQGISFM